MERTIIHLNIADFAVAVETNIQPALAGRPLIISPLDAPRALVYDMSEEAFQEGIRKGMPLAQAKRLNKKIKILPPSFNQYEKVMKDLFKETSPFTPLVESGTLNGHLYLDVTGSSRLFGPGVDVAFKLKKNFKKTFNLNPVWSVASNKLVAKVATRMVKPFGEYIIAPGEEEAFLATLPIHLIPGFTRTDLKNLYTFNLTQVSQAKSLSLEQLKIPFEQRASQIHNWLRGIDSTPITASTKGLPYHMQHNAPPTVISADHEFKNDTNNNTLLKKGLYLICEKICHRLRQQTLIGKQAHMTLSHSDGVQRTAKLKISPPTTNDIMLFKQTLNLLNKTWTRRVRIRHMRLEIKQLCSNNAQADLFAPRTKEIKQAGLIQAMDHIRKKFGRHSIRTGLTLTTEDTNP